MRATGPVIRSAASRPLISTIGTPTPGCTDDPARTTFSGPRRGRVEGRNGPVCPKVCASANGVPAAMPCAAQSSGVAISSTSIAPVSPVQPRASSVASTSSR